MNNASMNTTMEDHLECPICNEIVLNNMECTQCSNIFCRTCIDRWMQQSRCCPVCKREESNMFVHNRFVEKLADKSQVSCPNAGCEQSGRILRGDLAEHLQRFCSMRTVQCDMSQWGCTWNGTQAHKEEHMERECALWRARDALAAMKEQVESWKRRAFAAEDREDATRRDFLDNINRQRTEQNSSSSSAAAKEENKSANTAIVQRRLSSWMSEFGAAEWMHRARSYATTENKPAQALRAMLYAWRNAEPDFHGFATLDDALRMQRSSTVIDRRFTIFHTLRSEIFDELIKKRALANTVKQWIDNQLAEFQQRDFDDDDDEARVLLLCHGWLLWDCMNDALGAQRDFEHIVNSATLGKSDNSRSRSLIALAMYGLGRIHLQQPSMMSTALDMFTRGLDMCPSMALLYNSRAVILMQQSSSSSSMDEALRDLDLAIKLNSENHTAHNARAQAYIKMARYLDALKDLDAAIQLRESFAPAYRERAMLRENYFKDVQGAMRDYEHSLRIDPDNALVAQRLHRLRQQQQQGHSFGMDQPMQQQQRQQRQRRFVNGNNECQTQ